MTLVLQLLGGVLGIAVLLTLHALAIYAIWRIVMIVISFVPMIGRRHRHRDWDRLNRSQWRG